MWDSHQETVREGDLDAPSRFASLLVDFLLVPFRLRTWGSIAYVWLSFPLGIVAFVAMTVGFLTGAALTLIWVGFLVLLATFLFVWGLAGLERQLAIALLGANVPARRHGPGVDGTLTAWFKGILTNPAMWKGIGFLFLRFPLGTAGFVLSVVSLAVSWAFFLTPLVWWFGWGDIDLPFYVVDSFADTIPLGLFGAGMLFFTLHLHAVLGWIWARLAEALLGTELPEAFRPDSSAPPASLPSPLPTPAT